MLAGASEITVFPTIASDKLYIAVPGVADNASFSIYDAAGKKVDEGVLNELQSQISVKSLASGNYIVSVISGADKKVAKFVKQ